MEIVRTSMISGKTRAMKIGVTEEQLQRYYAGELSQDVFPHLTADEREFIQTGITAEEWDNVFSEE